MRTQASSIEDASFFAGSLGSAPATERAGRRRGAPASYANPGQFHRGCELLRVLVGFGADDGYGEDGRRALEILRGLEALAVGAHGGGWVRGAEVRGEGVA